MNTKIIPAALSLICAFATNACVVDEEPEDGYDDTIYDEEDGDEDVAEIESALGDGSGYGKLSRETCMAAAVELYTYCKEQQANDTSGSWPTNKCEDELAKHVAWCKANTEKTTTTTVVVGGGLKLSP